MRFGARGQGGRHIVTQAEPLRGSTLSGRPSLAAGRSAAQQYADSPDSPQGPLQAYAHRSPLALAPPSKEIPAGFAAAAGAAAAARAAKVSSPLACHQRLGCYRHHRDESAQTRGHQEPSALATCLHSAALKQRCCHLHQQSLLALLPLPQPARPLHLLFLLPPLALGAASCLEMHQQKPGPPNAGEFAVPGVGGACG